MMILTSRRSPRHADEIANDWQFDYRNLPSGGTRGLWNCLSIKAAFVGFCTVIVASAWAQVGNDRTMTLDLSGGKTMVQPVADMPSVATPLVSEIEAPNLGAQVPVPVPTSSQVFPSAPASGFTPAPSPRPVPSPAPVLVPGPGPSAIPAGASGLGPTPDADTRVAAEARAAARSARQAALPPLPEVGAVEVKTLRGTPIDPTFVLFNTRTQVGASLSQTMLAEDIRALQRTGRFAMVRSESSDLPDGRVGITYIVQPRANLRGLSITGMDAFKRSLFEEKLALKRGDLVDETRVEVALSRVREHYRKRFYPDPDIEFALEVDPDTGAADLYVEITEYKKEKIEDIRFVGGSIPEERLRKIMETKEPGFIPILMDKGLYDEGAVAADRAKIREAYRNEGYLDVKVGEANTIRRETPSVDRITVEYPVEEGDRYRMGSIVIEGMNKFPVQEVRTLMPAKVGGVARLDEVERSVQTVGDYYRSRGHVSAVVTRKLDFDPEKNTVDLLINVEEGSVATVRDIKIRGNVDTKDHVIRRELGFFPGEVYDEVAVRQAERKLRNTGLFGYAKATRRATSEPDAYDVIVDVEEARTGSLLTGFGFSSTENLVGFVEFKLSNFDLFDAPYFKGGGQKISVRASLGSERTDFALTHVEPWLFDQKLRLTTSLFQNESRFFSDDYDQKNLGGRIGLTRSLSDFWRGGLAYELENIDVFDVSTNASERIRIEEGDNWQSSVIGNLVFDSRDRFWNPTKGHKSDMRVKWSGGPLGFDVDLYELRLRSQHHWPIWRDHVLSMRGNLTTVDSHGGGRVPIFDRNFLGGPRTVRGFGFRDVGPVDEDLEPLGGQSEWFYSAEYTIPLDEQFRFAFIYDMGMVEEKAYDWDFGNFNSSAGVGLRIDSFFPMQLDYSWPIEAESFNDRSNGRFYFTIGGTFD